MLVPCTRKCTAKVSGVKNGKSFYVSHWVWVRTGKKNNDKNLNFNLENALEEEYSKIFCYDSSQNACYFYDQCSRISTYTVAKIPNNFMRNIYDWAIH